MSEDQKIKQAASKVPLGLVPKRALVGAARVFGYGARKYAPGNYYSATLADGAGERYISAALRHLSEMQEPNGLHTTESLASADPESGLPHIDHLLCGLMMLRSIMVKSGALPVDPGVGLDPPTTAERARRRTPSRPLEVLAGEVAVEFDAIEERAAIAGFCAPPDERDADTTELPIVLATPPVLLSRQANGLCVACASRRPPGKVYACGPCWVMLSGEQQDAVEQACGDDHEPDPAPVEFDGWRP